MRSIKQIQTGSKRLKRICSCGQWLMYKPHKAWRQKALKHGAKRPPQERKQWRNLRHEICTWDHNDIWKFPEVLSRVKSLPRSWSVMACATNRVTVLSPESNLYIQPSFCTFFSRMTSYFSSYFEVISSSYEGPFVKDVNFLFHLKYIHLLEWFPSTKKVFHISFTINN